jgi:hypothetical protein
VILIVRISYADGRTTSRAIALQQGHHDIVKLLDERTQKLKGVTETRTESQ